MALAFNIKTAAYNKLSDEMKAEYIAGDKDGEYVLDVAGLPEPEDTGPLKRARDAEKAKAADYKKKLDEANDKLAATPDVEALKAQHEKDIAKYKTFTEKTLLDATADQIATKISNAPKLLAPHIKARLVTDLTGDVPVTKVLGLDGKVSDMTLDKLSEEFVANKDFGAIITASKARGGGAPTVPAKPSGGGAPAGNPEQQAVDFSKLSGNDLAARITAKREAAAQQQ